MQAKPPSASPPAYILHLVKALLLEAHVADSEHFVHNQNLRLKVRGNSECEAHVHPRRIKLDGRLGELLKLGERDDLVEFPRNFRAMHSQDRAVEVDILAARQFGVKA